MDEHVDGEMPSRSAETRSTVAGRVGLARERAELRRERDRVLVGLGQTQLAKAFGLAPTAAARIVQDARERIDQSAQSSPRDEITIRRLRERRAVELSASAAARVVTPAPRDVRRQ